MYLCYGMHWLANVITGDIDCPQGVLLRAGENYSGPAKLTKRLLIDKSFNGLDICTNGLLWIEDDGRKFEISTAPRVGIDYAGDEWKNKPWRFIMGKEIKSP